jgi:hypothetical protein
MARIKDVAWHREYNDTLYPFCPYCDEFAYEKDHCVFCGKKYRWVSNKESEPTIVEQDGYRAVQVGNGHVHIYTGERWVYYASCTTKMSEDELRNHIPFVKEFRNEK